MFSKKNSIVFRKRSLYSHNPCYAKQNILLLFLRKTFVTVVEQIDYFCWRRCYSCRKDWLQMLSKLFLMRKRFVTFAEGVTLTEQICYKCWASCSSWERDSLLLHKSYCDRTDLLQMLSKLFLMRKRFVTFAEGVTLTEQICYKCWASCFSWERDSLLLLKGLLLQNRSVTNAEQVVSHEEEIHYFCRRSDKCWVRCFSWVTD